MISNWRTGSARWQVRRSDALPRRDEDRGRDRLAAPGRDVGYRLTPTGRQTFDEFGLDLDDIERHRPVVRYWLDWSEQRHHLAGPLGTALAGRLFDLDWIRRTSRRRGLSP